MLVELSIREIEMIKHLIAERQLTRPLVLDRLTDEDESTIAVMLKLFMALEDGLEVPTVLN